MTLMEMANGMKGVFCMTHAPDFDGISSAALIVHYMKAPESHLFFSYPNVEDLRDGMGALLSAGPEGSLIIFTDVSVNDDAVPYILEAIGRLKQSGNSVAWIDHHPWSEHAAKELEGACDFLLWGEGDECAAEKAISALGASDGYAAEIKRLAHITDFNLPLPKGEEELILDMVRAITYLKNRNDMTGSLRRMAGLVSRGDFRNQFILDAAQAYIRESKQEIERLKQDCSLHEVNGYRIGIGYARNIQSTQACAIIEEQLHTDIEAFINTEDYKLSLRSRKGVDCSAIASALGGGGHPQASGAVLEIKDDGEIQKGISAILKAAASSLHNGKGGR